MGAELQDYNLTLGFHARQQDHLAHPCIQAPQVGVCVGVKAEAAPPPHPPSPGEMCAVGVIPIAGLPEPSFSQRLAESSLQAQVPRRDLSTFFLSW